MANFVLFQIGWFACVSMAAARMPWLGVAVVAAIAAAHLATRGRRDAVLIAMGVATGAVVDTALLHTGIVHYASPTPPEFLAPAWIVAMWANFAMTLRHSLSWLGERPVAAVLLGGIFGPLAYWGAARMGAASFPRPLVATGVLALIWGTAVPLLFAVSRAHSATSTREG